MKHNNWTRFSVIYEADQVNTKDTLLREAERSNMTVNHEIKYDKDRLYLILDSTKNATRSKWERERERERPYLFTPIYLFIYVSIYLPFLHAQIYIFLPFHFPLSPTYFFCFPLPPAHLLWTTHFTCSHFPLSSPYTHTLFLSPFPLSPLCSPLLQFTCTWVIGLWWNSSSR